MSGHSRWAGIKHKKAIIDSKRGKVFTRVAREITIAAKQGGGKPENNPRLRKAIEDARGVNMPAENVKRAVQRGTGELPGVSFEEVKYEGYGPGGVAVIIDATTDNKNRTTSEIRHMLDSHGGNLGESGSVSWMFEHKGYIAVPKSSVDEEKITTLAIDLGAEDIKTDDDQVYEIITAPADFENIKSKLSESKIVFETAEVSFLPKNTIPLEGDQAKRCLDLMNLLDEHDDVTTAHANFDISQETMDKNIGRVMRVLGIDPGLAILGWSIVDVDGDAVSLVAFGVLRTPAHVALTKRLCDVHENLSALFGEHKPSHLALETLFFVKNAKTLAQVGHARGVILLVAGQQNVDVFEYAPRQIKLALTGTGAAEKFQMQSMVQRRLKLKEIPQPDDAADAVAVALCHAQYAQTMGKIGGDGMIAQLNGKIIDVSLDKDVARVVVDVHGVGYEVLVTATSQSKISLGQTLVLHVCESVTAFDGATTLYGFLTRDDKEVFTTLRHNVDGMGPKKALECLEKISKSLPDFKRAILDNDTRLLVSVFGFTKKTAEKLVVSLKDGVGAWTMSGSPKWAEGAGKPEEVETLSALINLGYDQAEARELLRLAKQNAGENATVEALLQESLRLMSQKR